MREWERGPPEGPAGDGGRGSTLASGATAGHGLGVGEEVFDLLSRSKNEMKEKPEEDTSPFGLEANRRNLEVAVDYVYRQGMIPRRYGVEELFG